MPHATGCLLLAACFLFLLLAILAILAVLATCQGLTFSLLAAPFASSRRDARNSQAVENGYPPLLYSIPTSHSTPLSTSHSTPSPPLTLFLHRALHMIWTYSSSHGFVCPPLIALGVACSKSVGLRFGANCTASIPHSCERLSAGHSEEQTPTIDGARSELHVCVV